MIAPLQAVKSASCYVTQCFHFGVPFHILRACYLAEQKSHICVRVHTDMIDLEMLKRSGTAREKVHAERITPVRCDVAPAH